MKSPTSDLRRFSYGGHAAALADVAVWKFDALIQPEHRAEARVTCYVKLASRGDAFQALFAHWPKATVLGTGLPLTDDATEAELGWRIDPGAVVVMQGLAELGRDGATLWWGG
jgi:hypothetical protein